ncbi:MAG: hypothetical protein NTX50_08870 [Candidatus Sumerlaeota bacterium]|nr:hypothetical protein [Candidatus Sumerlaeota bacterium]
MDFIEQEGNLLYLIQRHPRFFWKISGYRLQAAWLAHQLMTQRGIEQIEICTVAKSLAQPRALAGPARTKEKE